MEFGPVRASNPHEARERAARLLDDEIRALVAGHGSHLAVAAEVVEGSPGETLARAARTADLLVLGSHGHSRVRRTVLGSVSEACIRHATCAVVVVPVPVPERSAAEPVPAADVHRTRRNPSPPALVVGAPLAPGRAEGRGGTGGGW